MTVVFGQRAAAAGPMYRPLIALRWWVPLLWLEPTSVTLVRGWRAAAAGEMYRPVMALRL